MKASVCLWVCLYVRVCVSCLPCCIELVDWLLRHFLATPFCLCLNELSTIPFPRTPALFLFLLFSFLLLLSLLLSPSSAYTLQIGFPEGIYRNCRPGRLAGPLKAFS